MAATAFPPLSVGGGGGVASLVIAANGTGFFVFGPVHPDWWFRCLWIYARPMVTGLSSVQGLNGTLMGFRVAPGSDAAFDRGRPLSDVGFRIPIGQWSNAATLAREPGLHGYRVFVPPPDVMERFVGLRLVEPLNEVNYDGFITPELFQIRESSGR